MLQELRGVRLIAKDGSVSPSAGRLEVFYNGTWGTVSDDSPNDPDKDQQNNNMAIVVCRMLGLKGGVVKVDTDFGAGSGKVWLDDVGCTGNEATIFDCKHLPWGVNDKSHKEDVGVVCQT